MLQQSIDHRSNEYLLCPQVSSFEFEFRQRICGYHCEIEKRNNCVSARRGIKEREDGSLCWVKDRSELFEDLPEMSIIENFPKYTPLPQEKSIRNPQPYPPYLLWCYWVPFQVHGSRGWEGLPNPYQNLWALPHPPRCFFKSTFLDWETVFKYWSSLILFCSQISLF